MAREEKAIFTNLCMITDANGNLLVEDRKDPNWPGICFPGGHVEPGEAFTDSVIREVWEETGLTIENPILCGTKQFQTNNGERYVVFFYKTDRFSGTLRSSQEGEVFWIPREELKDRRCVVDLEKMLEVFDRNDLNEFQYRKKDGEFELRLL